MTMLAQTLTVAVMAAASRVLGALAPWWHTLPACNEDVVWL
jgi:hypothetical protein